MADLYTQLTGGLSALAQARLRPVDLVMIGDSNQLMNGTGYDHGLGKALATRFGLYATPLYSQQISSDQYGNSGFASAGISGVTNSATTGAPSTFDDFRLPQQSYCYQASGDMGQFNGIYVNETAPGLDVSASLRCHYAYGIFATGGGSFVPAARLEGSPYTTLATGASVSCAGASDTIGYTTLDVAAGARSLPLGFKWRLGGGTANVGKTCQIWQRVENIARQSGVSINTMYGEAGQSLYDMAAAVTGLTNARVQNYFAAVTRLQRLRGLPPMVVVWVNSAPNDRNETSTPSLGPLATSGPTTALAWIDNFEAIRLKLDAAWAALGYDMAGLTYWVSPGHPISDPDDAQYVTYRAILSLYIAGKSRMAMTDMSTLITSATMLANGWYNSGGSDKIHLVTAGYEGMGTLLTGQVP